MNRSLDAVVLRYVGYALLFGAAAYLLFLIRGALPIFFVAGLLVYAMEPVLQWLERSGRSRRTAVTLVFLIFLLLFALLFTLLATAWQQVQVLASQAPEYQEKLQNVMQAGRERLEEVSLPANIKKAVLEGVQDFQDHAPRLLSSKIQGAVSWTLSSIGLLLLVGIVLPIITLWLMLEMNPLRARVLMLVPAQYRRDVMLISSNINELLGRYVRGQMIVCSLYGVLCTVVFYLLNFLYGMQYPLALGVLAALIYIVPYLGMATIATAAGMTAYFTSSSPILCAALAVASCFFFNLIIDYGVTPRIIGKGVGLHPLLVIFALLAGAQIGGVMGMILAIPFFASLRVVAIHLFPQLTAPIPQSTPETEEPEKPSPQEITEAVLKETAQLEARAES